MYSKQFKCHKKILWTVAESGRLHFVIHLLFLYLSGDQDYLQLQVVLLRGKVYRGRVKVTGVL